MSGPAAARIPCDVIVIGGGIAGLSVAADLARDRKVVVLEREAQPGQHSTGRSAALFSEIYGSPPIRALSRASRSFLTTPPPGFAETPLVTPRGTLFIARHDQLEALRAFATAPDVTGAVREISAAEALRLSPLLRPDYVAAGVYEPEAADLDVHALLTGFLRVFKAHGGELHSNAEVFGLTRDTRGWNVETSRGRYAASIVVNAAGAWVDTVADLAGIGRIGAEPRRRTAITVDGPAGLDLSQSPLTIDITEQFYFKPDAGRLLLSPADETPSAPCDAQADEWDIAVAIDRLETATSLQVRRVHAKWAGLRTFVADRSPVVGYDPVATGFFWLAGQGGYGIQTAPALARLAAALVRGREPPADIQDTGLALVDISPARLG